MEPFIDESRQKLLSAPFIAIIAFLSIQNVTGLHTEKMFTSILFCYDGFHSQSGVVGVVVDSIIFLLLFS